MCGQDVWGVGDDPFHTPPLEGALGIHLKRAPGAQSGFPLSDGICRNEVTVQLWWNDFHVPGLHPCAQGPPFRGPGRTAGVDGLAGPEEGRRPPAAAPPRLPHAVRPDRGLPRKTSPMVCTPW